MRPAVDRKIPGASPGGGTIPTLVTSQTREFDLYDSQKRLLAALKSLSEDSAVSEENKKHIQAYIRYNQAQGIKAIRLKKSVYMLRDMAKT